MTTMTVGERDFGSLEEAVRQLTAQWRHQDEAATRGRRALHDKVDDLSHRVTIGDVALQRIQSDIADIKNRIEDKIMPTIDSYKLDKASSRRLSSVGKGIWIGLIGAITAGAAFIHQIIGMGKH